ncbi:hypothetical protein VTI28DRAFT_7696 [Corynascus sepedonium]
MGCRVMGVKSVVCRRQSLLNGLQFSPPTGHRALTWKAKALNARDSQLPVAGAPLILQRQRYVPVPCRLSCAPALESCPDPTHPVPKQQATNDNSTSSRFAPDSQTTFPSIPLRRPAEVNPAAK